MEETSVLQKWDLVEYTEKLLDYDKIVEGIKNLKLETEHPKYEVGDLIEFNVGFYNNIRATSRITGFDKDGGIYVLWDCYWVPTFEDEKRNITKVD